jgi:hypothetical protein
MRKIKLIVLRAGSAALILTAPLVFSAAPANAQAMGEYGTTIGQSGGIGPSSSTLPPPSSYTNPVGGGSNGSTSTVEVYGDDRRVDDDASSNRDDHDSKDANSGDEWSEAR